MEEVTRIDDHNSGGDTSFRCRRRSRPPWRSRRPVGLEMTWAIHTPSALFGEDGVSRRGDSESPGVVLDHESPSYPERRPRGVDDLRGITDQHGENFYDPGIGINHEEIQSIYDADGFPPTTKKARAGGYWRNGRQSRLVHPLIRSIYRVDGVREPLKYRHQFRHRRLRLESQHGVDYGVLFRPIEGR